MMPGQNNIKLFDKCHEIGHSIITPWVTTPLKFTISYHP